MNTTLSKPKSVEKFVKYETEEPRSSTSLPKLSQSLLIPENILKIVTSKNKSISTKLSNTKNSRRDLSRTCTAASKKTSKTPKKGKEGDSGRVMFKNFLKNVKGNSCRKVINNSCSQKKQNSCNGGKFKRFRFKEKEKINQENSKKLREQRLIDFRAERLEKIKQRNLSNHSELKLKKFKQFKNIFGGKYKKKKKIAIRSANCSSSPSKPLMYFQKFKEAQRKRSKVMKQNFKFFKNSKNSKKSKKNQKWKNLISSKNYNKKTRLVCSRKSSKKKLLGLSSDKLNQTMSFFHNKKDPKKFEKFNKTETKFYPNTSNRSINRSGSRKNDILWKIRMKKKSVKASEGSKESIVKKLNFNRKNLLSNHNPFLMYKKASLDIGDMNKSLVSTTKKMKKSSRKDVLKHIQKERRNSKSEFLNLMKIQQKKQRSFDFKNHFTGQKKGRKTSYAGSYDHVGHSNSQIEKEEDLKKSRFLRKKGISTATNYNSIQYKKKKLLDTEYSGKKYKYFKKILTSPDDPESDEDHDDDLYRSLMLEGKNRESVLTRMDYTNFLSESIIVHNNNDAFEKIKKKFLFKGRRYYLDDLKDFLMGNKDDWMSKEDFGYFKSVYFEHFKQGFNALRQHRVPKHRQKYEGILDLNIELHPCSIKYLPKLKDRNKKTLVLDLDETLVHCFTEEDYPWDYKIKIPQIDGGILNAKLNIRPYAKKFLENISKNFEIILFTASEKYYADTILEYLDPERKFISHRFYRESCFKVKNFGVKDLRVIGNRDPKKLILVDNSTSCFLPQLHNGIPIIPFYFKEDDFELLKLEFLLNDLSDCEEDVRDFLYNFFHLEMYLEVGDIEELAERLLC